jgi:hypothetical protein
MVDKKLNNIIMKIREHIHSHEKNIAGRQLKKVVGFVQI